LQGLKMTMKASQTIAVRARKKIASTREERI
jgi:hypothetical protein